MNAVSESSSLVAWPRTFYLILARSILFYNPHQLLLVFCEIFPSGFPVGRFPEIHLLLCLRLNRFRVRLLLADFSGILIGQNWLIKSRFLDELSVFLLLTTAVTHCFLRHVPVRMLRLIHVFLKNANISQIMIYTLHRVML